MTLVASTAYPYAGPRRPCHRCESDLAPGDVVRAVHLGSQARGVSVAHERCADGIPHPLEVWPDLLADLDLDPAPDPQLALDLEETPDD